MQLTFSELLDYLDEERTRWQSWFAEHEDALAFPLPGPQIPNVRELVRHALGVQLWFAETLSGEPVTEWWTSPEPTARELFALGEKASSRAWEYIGRATPEDWCKIIDLDGKGAVYVTARKAMANSLIHAIRHWAQLAVIVRQNGIAPPGQHDLILSSALR